MAVRRILGENVDTRSAGGSEGTLRRSKTSERSREISEALW